MASSEVIQKEVASNSEMQNNPGLIQEEGVVNKKSEESTAVESVITCNAAAPVLEHQQQPPLQTQQPAIRTRTSREEKMRKKDDKSVDHVLKALNSLNTTEEKLAAMCKKYADIFDENRKVQLALKQAEKRCSTLQREKEQLQTEHSKAILTRSRLENLCRELQRQNKAIKDESLLKIREEEEKRKEVSAKFQTTLNEITTLMQQNNDKNMKLRDDNIEMNAKLKNVCEQYELREQQVEKISKQMQLEAQLADAKLAKAKMEMAAEREIMLREKQQLLMELSQYQSRCQEFQATEITLRTQISTYDEKYDEFQKALTRSNEVFGGFKGEMEKMSKKMCKLEKEVSTWKQRWEGSHRALLEMADEKQRADQELSHANRQVATLQRLCRTLQGERSTLLDKLKGVSTSESKIQDSVENASNQQLKSNAQNSSEQLVNGDLTEINNVAKDNSYTKTTSDLGEIASVEQNGVIELTQSVEECVPEKSTSLPLNQFAEETPLKLCSVNNSISSILSNDPTSFESVINDPCVLSPPPPPPPSDTAEVEPLIASDTFLSPLKEALPSDTTTKTNSSTLIKPPNSSSSAVDNNETVTKSALVKQSVTNLSTSTDTSILNKDNESNESNSDKTNLAAGDVLKSTVMLSSPNVDTTDKQHIEGSHPESIKKAAKENCLTDLKEKSDVQPVKNQSNEHKKGKESRKKKKNT